MTDSKPVRVLYVEDDTGLVRLMQRRLERHGFEVDVALDGEEGLAKYDPEKYDVLVLDQNLPGYYGLEVLRKLSETRHLIPTIMLTGSGDEKTAVEALKLGAKDYIVKDVEAGYLELLPSVIEQSLHTYRLEQAKIQAEAALKESESRYRELVQNSLGLIFTHDLDGVFQTVNPAMAELFGYAPDAMVGMNLSALLVSPDSMFLEDYLRECQQARTSDGVMYAHTKDGEERILMYRVSTQENESGVPSVLGHALDITERQRREENLQMLFEEEKRLNLFRSRLITTLSHEFRTPLTIISTVAEIVQRYQERLTPEKLADYFLKILEQVHSLDDILTDILYMYKSETAQMELQPRWFDLEALCRELLEPLALSAQADHEIEFRIIGTPIPVFLDHSMLQQIINNLMFNAIKYSPDGGKVLLELKYADDHVEIGVEDEGIGIPPDEVEHLFTIFHRASNVGNISGTGVGLAIVRQTVEMHKGKIDVQSRLGKGTRFEVWLPHEVEVTGQPGDSETNGIANSATF